MNPLNVFVLVVTVAASSNAYYAEAPMPGSVEVNENGASITGPSGFVRTDNGLDGQGGSALLSGPGGEIHTRAGVLVVNRGGSGHASAPAFTRAGLAAPNYLPAPVFSRPTLATSGVTPSILADPYIAHRKVLAAPAYSHPIVGAPGITRHILGGSVPRLDCGLGGLGHGINGLGY